MAPGAQLLSVDFTLAPERAIRVRGTVFDSVTGQPGRNAQIALVSRDPTARGLFQRGIRDVEDALGRFEVRAPTRGSYFLVAWLSEQSQLHVARVPLEVGGADMDDVNVVLGPTAELTGRVRLEENVPSKLPNVRVALVPRINQPFFGVGDGNVNDDGSFSIPNVGEDLYDLNLWGLPEDTYLKSARSGSEDILERGLAVGRGKGSSALELVLGTPGGRVEGQVVTQDGLPAAGATVVPFFSCVQGSSSAAARRPCRRPSSP